MKKLISLILILIYFNANAFTLFAEESSSTPLPTQEAKDEAQEEAEKEDEHQEAIDTVYEQLEDTAIEVIVTFAEKAIMGELKEASSWGGSCIGMVIHFVINTIKRNIAHYDTYGTGVHVYIDSNEIIDPAKNSKKYGTIYQSNDNKTAVGIFVEDLNSKNAGSNSYVYNTTVKAVSYAADAYGYSHSNSGAAKSSEVGGVMNSSFTALGYEGVAVGIHAADGTTFTGGDVTTTGGDEITLGVSYNTIFAADALWTVKYTDWGYFSDSASGNVAVYGIYADGDWSAIDLLYNSIVARAYYADAVGIQVVVHTFCENIIGNDITATTLNGAATGILFSLDAGDLESIKEPFTWHIFFPDLDSDDDGESSIAEWGSDWTGADKGEDVEVEVDVDTLCIASISDGTIYVANTGGEDSSFLNTDNVSTTAAGILFTGGNYIINSITDYTIVAATEGSGAYGIAFDYSDEDTSIIVGYLSDLDITVYSSSGLAAAIYLDTNSYDDEGNVIGEVITEPFIHLIANLNIDVTAVGNVYGYALGDCFGYSTDDGGFGLYNSAYGSSQYIADNIDYDSISLTVTSLGINSTYSGNAAYGIYLSGIDYTMKTVTMDYDDLSDTLSADDMISALAAKDITVTADELSDLEIVITNIDLNTLTGDLSISVGGEEYTDTGVDISGANITNYLDLSFRYIEVSAAGYAYGIYLDDSTLGAAVKTEIVINTTGPESYGVYMTNESTLNGLSSSISFDSVKNLSDLGTVYMTAVDIDSTSYITEISSDISFDLTYLNNFVIKGISVGDSSSLGSFSGTFSTSTKDYSTFYVTENFYGYLIGKQLYSDESLLLYNDELKTSEGISIDSSVSIVLNNIATSDATKWNVYGAYVTGSSSDVDIDFDISVKEAVGIGVYDGASVSLVDNTISGYFNYIDGTNTTLTINEGAFLQGYTSVSNGATLEIIGNVSFENSTIEINNGSSLTLEAYASISLDSDSNLLFNTGSVLYVNLSDVDSIVNYTIITAGSSENYSDILAYLNTDGNSEVILSSAFDTQSYSSATFGDKSDDIEVSYSAIFTGDGSTSISVNIVSIGEFDYFKLVEDSYGNNIVEIASDYADSTFSAYSSNNTRVETNVYTEKIEHSFINLSEEKDLLAASGAAIYNASYSISEIIGDFVANYTLGGVESKGGAIYNTSSIGTITGDFIGNSAIAGDFAFGGAIYNAQYDETSKDPEISAITGNFAYNYAYSLLYAFGGAIYNAYYADISTISGNFEYNYAYATEENSYAVGGAIYNAEDAEISTITGNFAYNYAYSSGENSFALGGAIFNAAYMEGIIGDIIGNYACASAYACGGAIYLLGQDYATVSIKSLEGNIIGNYVLGETVARGGAIYNCGAEIYFCSSEGNDYYYLGNWASTDSTIDENDDINGGFLYIELGDYGTEVYFDTAANSSITIGDGSAGYDSIAGEGTIYKTGDGILTVNSSMQYFIGKVEVQEGTFALSSNIGIGATDTYLEVTVSNGATFNISNNDYYDKVTMYDGLSLTLNDGATLLFDAYASLYISSGVDITLNTGSTFSIDFTGVYEDFEYTLFEIEDADTYAYIKSFLNETDTDGNLVNVDVSSAYALIDSLEDAISSTQFAYGDNTENIEYSFTLNYDDSAQTIGIELCSEGDFVYFAWGVGANGNITLSEVDISSDKDLITYSTDNTRLENFSGEIAQSFLGLSATNGGAIYNYNSTDSTDIVISSITSDFVGNSSSARGGAIYNFTHNADGISNNISIGDITGSFVGNSAYSTSSYTRGGAISNMAASDTYISIGTITGDFIGNYAYSSKSSSSTQGGAIYNYSYSGSSGISITGIAGGFSGNYAYSATNNATGGAIFNEAYANISIGEITGDFIANYVYSASGTAQGGAIYNHVDASGVSITMDFTSSFIGNYAYSESGSVHGGAIYNNAQDGTITLNFDASNNDIEFTGNYTNSGGVITSNAIYNNCYSAGKAIINLSTADSYTIEINDGISGGTTHVANQILNIAGSVSFNNSVQNQTVNVNSGTLTLASYEGTSDLYGDGSNVEVASSIASLSNSKLEVVEGATLNVAATGIEITGTTITLADNSTLSFDLYASLILDESSSINLSSNVELELNTNGNTGEFDYTILTIENDSLYAETLAYLEGLYITLDIGVAIADYGDTFFNIEVSGDGENINLSTYLVGEISYFEWTTLGGIKNIVLVEVEYAGNIGSAAISAYSASNNRIIGSEYGDTVSAADLQASFVGLSQTQEKDIAQGGAIFNDSSSVAISIGELEGDFIGNTASSSASYAQGGAWYNYASNNDITMGNLTSDFLGNSAFSTESYVQGGALYNYADSASIDYALIISNFYINYAYTSDSSNTGKQNAQGGAIYNYVADDGDASISIDGIRGDFEGNYTYSVYANALGGAIYNESYSDLNIVYIVSDFYANYAANNDAAKAQGGAIYNYTGDADSSIEIGYITGDFLGNYAYSLSGEAQGGAIYNYAENGSIDMTLQIALGDMEMTGNYVNNGGTITSNAIYNSASETGTSTIYLLAGEDSTLSINDGISGSDNVANQILSINKTDDDGTEYIGTVAFNNAVENQSISVYNGTLELGGYDGTDNLFSDEDIINVSVDSSIASLDNVDLTISYGATLIISTNSDDDVVSVSNSTVTFESGSTWHFYNCAHVDIDYSTTTLNLADDQVVEFSSLSTSELTLSEALEFLLEEASTINHTGEGSLTINADLGSSTSFNLTNGTLNFGGETLAGILNISEGTDFNIIVNADNKGSSNILTGDLAYDSEDNLEIDILIADIFEILDSKTVIYDTDDYTNIGLALDTVFDEEDVYLTNNTTLNVESSVTAIQDDGSATFSIETTGNTITVSGDYSVGEGESYNIDTINNDDGSLILDGGELSLNIGAELILGGDDADVIAINGTLNAVTLESIIKVEGDIEVGDLTISGNLYGDDVAISGSSLTFVDVNLAGSIAFENIAISGELSYDVAKGEEASLLTVSEDNATISGELYITHNGEGELTVYEVTSSTGDITFEDGAVISLTGTGDGYALANDHDFTGDNGITATLQGEATIIGDIKVESPFTLNAYSYTDTDGETYTVENAKLTLQNGTLETGDTNTSNSDDLTVNGATLALENYTIDTDGGDINLVGGSLGIDGSSSLVSVGTINMTTDTAANMSKLELSIGADIGNATITIVGSASMLKNSTYEDTITADNISALTIENKYGDFDVDTSGTLSVDSLSYFQETKAGNANEMALAYLLDELEDIGDDYDSAYKIAFKLALDEAGLDSVIMNSYSNIAEVNTMLLSNLNFANVNRARAILDKNAGAYLTEEEIIEEATGIALEAQEVALIKYTNLAQLQSINLLGSKDSAGGVAGYDYWSVGSLANMDNILSENALVGVSIGGTYNKSEGDNGDVANSTTFLLNAYGVVKSGIYPFEIFANIGYAHFWNEASKNGFNSKWDSDAFNVLGGIAFDFETGIENLNLKPLAILNMAMLNSESASYSDTIEIDNQSYISAKLMLGFEVEYAINAQFNAIIRAMYSHEFGDESYDFSYGFADGIVSDIAYTGSQAGRDSAVIGFSLSYDFSETCTAYFDYNAYVYESLITHSLNLSVAIKF